MNRIRKACALLLSLCLTVMLIPGTVLAADIDDTKGDSADYSVYVATCQSSEDEESALHYVYSDGITAFDQTLFDSIAEALNEPYKGLIPSTPEEFDAAAGFEFFSQEQEKYQTMDVDWTDANAAADAVFPGEGTVEVTENTGAVAASDLAGVQFHACTATKIASIDQDITLYRDSKANVVEADSYTALAEAVQQAAADGTQTVIRITADFSLDGTITIQAGQNICLEDDGTLRRLTAAHSQTLFVVEADAVFTLAGSAENSLILDGDGRNAQKLSHGQAVDCHGRFVLDGAVIENVSSVGTSSGVVYISGQNAAFELKAGEIRNNVIDSSALSSQNATVHATAGAQVIISGGKITENQTSGVEKARTVTAGLLANSRGGDVHVEMTGGEISHNISTSSGDGGGGVWLCGNNWTYGYLSYRATMTLSGDGKIINNTADYGGGGIFVYGNAGLTMNGGLISQNTVTSGMGGGVATYDYFKDVQQMMGVGDDYINTWQNFVNTSFKMTGGEISNNTAQRGNAGGDGGCGGGVYVASNHVELLSGVISGNKSTRQGGGIYVGSTPYVLNMENTVIKENVASKLGGGLWFCPTGDVTSVVTNGSAIYDNTAQPAGDSAGDDLAIVPQGNTHFADLSVRMLGGGLVEWYHDGGITDDNGSNALGVPDFSTYGRYQAGVSEKVTEIQGQQNGIALKAIASDSVKALAESQATLWVTGNQSQRGGGIGSNGGVIIGVPDEEYTMTVRKDWGETPENKQVDVVVNLKIGDYTLDGVTLSADNNWTAVFEDLPKPASLTGGTEITVVEETPEGFTTSYSQAVIDDTAKTISITVTNTLIEVPTGSLTVSKTVEGSGGDQQRAWNFTVTLSDTTIQGTYGDLEFADGVAEFTLKHGESATAAGLPAGVQYTVAEAEANQEDYATTMTGETGEIAENKTAEAVFVNTKDQVSGEPPEEPEKPDSTTQIPQTGDDSQVGVWMILLAVACCGMAGTLVYSKKQKKSK